VYYSIYEEASVKRKRIKEYDANQIPGERERSRYARIRIAEPNHLLSEDACMNSAEDKEMSEAEKAKDEAEFMPFSKAVDFFCDSSAEKTYTRTNHYGISVCIQELKTVLYCFGHCRTSCS
jgi:hypothetical protein